MILSDFTREVTIAEYEPLDVIPDTAVLPNLEYDTSTVLSLSAYSIAGITADSAQWAQKASEKKVWTVQGIHALAFSTLVARIGNEPGDLINENESLECDYAHSLIERLENNVSTGLIHPEIQEAYNTLTKSEQNQVTDMLMHSAKELSEFQNIGDLRIVETATMLDGDFGAVHLPLMVPLLVQTATGIVGVMMVTDTTSRMVASLASRRTYSSTSAYIDDVHIWDFENNKISRASEEPSLDAENVLIKASHP